MVRRLEMEKMEERTNKEKWGVGVKATQLAPDWLCSTLLHLPSNKHTQNTQKRVGVLAEGKTLFPQTWTIRQEKEFDVKTDRSFVQYLHLIYWSYLSSKETPNVSVIKMTPVFVSSTPATVITEQSSVCFSDQNIKKHKNAFMDEL